MKNLLTQWELRRKTNPKLGASWLLLFGFFIRAVGKKPAVFPFDAVEPSRQRSNHYGLGPLSVETIGARAIGGQAIGGRDYQNSSHWESRPSELELLGVEPSQVKLLQVKLSQVKLAQVKPLLVKQQR